MADNDLRQCSLMRGLIVTVLPALISFSAQAREIEPKISSTSTNTTAQISPFFPGIDQLDLTYWLPYALLLSVFIPVMWYKSADFSFRINRVLFRTLSLLLLLVPLKSTMSPILISLVFSLPIQATDFILYLYAALLIFLGVVWTDQQKIRFFPKPADSLNRSQSA